MSLTFQLVDKKGSKEQHTFSSVDEAERFFEKNQNLSNAKLTITDLHAHGLSEGESLFRASFNPQIKPLSDFLQETYSTIRERITQGPKGKAVKTIKSTSFEAE